MKEVATSLHLLSGFPPAGFNVYAIESDHGWILVDTGSRFARRRVLRQLPGELEAIFITHAHRDHAGSMHAVAQERGGPVWSSSTDADALEGRAPEPFPNEYAGHPVNRLFGVVWSWDHHPVARRVEEGDSVAGFEVVAFPGHTPGQIGLWRESDHTVICADTMRSMNFVTGLPQLGEMPAMFTCDRAEARRSIRKLAALEPRVAGFGHGRPLTKGTAEKLNAFAAGLPV
jgi:hydroxyacylglutathione hydrolase